MEQPCAGSRSSALCRWGKGHAKGFASRRGASPDTDPSPLDPQLPHLDPLRGPSSFLSESASTLEGNMLEPVTRAGPSCHPPSCWDPGVWPPGPGRRGPLGRGWGEGTRAASDPPEAGREAGQEPQLQRSTLCYSLPPRRPLPPGSRPGLTPCFPPGRVPPPHWTKARAESPWWGLPGGNCLPGRNPRSLTQSPGCTAARQCVLILTSLRCKSAS